MFFILIAYIYSTTTTAIRDQQFLLNCPAPIFQGIAENVTFSSDSSRINYQIDYGGGGVNATLGTFFNCYIDTVPLIDVPTVVLLTKNYGHTVFGQIPDGWFAWAGDTISAFVDNLSPLLNILYLLVVAPSAIGSLTFFTYINIFLLIMIAFGIFLAVRG